MNLDRYDLVDWAGFVFIVCCGVFFASVGIALIIVAATTDGCFG